MESNNAGNPPTDQTTVVAASRGSFLDDLDNLRLPQDYAASLGVKKALLTVPVNKPQRQSFVRVHPDPEYRCDTMLLEAKEDRESYLVAPELWAELPGELAPKTLFTAITRQGVVLLWPIRLPGEDGRLDEWSRSAREAAELAMAQWVRVAGNQSLGAYEVFAAQGELADPTWPEHSFHELLKIAFKDRQIEDLEHPLVHQLLGRV